MYFFHPTPVPDECDVCAYVRDTDGEDQLLEHTGVRIAVGLMVEDLLNEGRPMRMIQLHRAGIGHPGPDHPIAPRHWFWALLVMPGFLIALDEVVTAAEGVS
jgi:hypothetical protein